MTFSVNIVAYLETPLSNNVETIDDSISNRVGTELAGNFGAKQHYLRGRRGRVKQ